MPNLSAPLLRQLRQTLLNTDEFSSDAKLRAVFVTDALAPFRNGLPEASSRAERVDLVVSYLANKHHANGQNALALFLLALAERHDPADGLVAQLQAVSAELSGVTPNSTPLSGAPVVQKTSTVSGTQNIVIQSDGSTININFPDSPSRS